MAAEITAKPLKASGPMEGLSQDQVGPHYETLYKGYVNKVNEIRGKLKAVDRSTANQTYSDLRALKTEESFALNGVKLHEAYFDNLGGSGGEPSGAVRGLIERDFGSVAKWEEDFRASGLAARGWVVLAWDLDDQQVHNYSSDAHNQGGIWAAVPLLVLDTYEHAYFTDYGARRAPYIDAFMKNVDWAEVNAKLAKLGVTG